MGKYLLLITFVLSGHLGTAQMKFVRAIELHKRLMVGGTIPATVQFNYKVDNTRYLGGWVDSMKVYDYQGIGKLYTVKNLNNVVKKVGAGPWVNGGNYVFPNSGYVVYGHSILYGQQYGGSYDSPHARVLNSNDTFGSHPKVNIWPGPFYSAYEWGNNEAVFLGKEAGSFYEINNVSCTMIGIVNLQTGAVRTVTSSYGQGIGWVRGQQMVGDTLYVLGTGIGDIKLWAIKKGTAVTIENLFPSLPCHVPRYMRVINGRMYVIIGTTTSKYELHTLKNGAWQKLATFEPLSYSNPDPTFGLVSYDGKLAVMGPFTSADGVSCKGFAFYDETTDTFTLPPSYPSEIGPASWAYMTVIDGELYLASRDDAAGFQTGQVVYAYRDVNTVPIPTFSMPTSSTVVVGSVEMGGSGAAPNSYIDLYLNGSNIVYGTVQVSANGTWSYVRDLPVGQYSFVARSRDTLGNVSAQSQAKIFKVDNVTGINDPIAVASTNVYPNPASRELILREVGVVKNLQAISLLGQSQDLIYHQSGTNVVAYVDRLASGTYAILVTNSRNKRFIAKVVIQR